MKDAETLMLIADYADHAQVYVDTVVDAAKPKLLPRVTTIPKDDRVTPDEAAGPSKRPTSPVIQKWSPRSTATAESVYTDGEEVAFRVGKERQLMFGSRSELASVSPVFRSLFNGPGRGRKNPAILDIPEIHTQSFGVILRCAARDNVLPLTEDTVWNVLQAADQFQILPVVTRCFHFLLHKHSKHAQSRHLCTVLEKAHQLEYREHQDKCLHRIKRHADKVLRSAMALSELCHQCMLEIVTADDLPGISEILIHDAVILWARAACKKVGKGGTEPTWEDLRVMAGPLVYQVRYLVMPRETLQGLRAGEPPCLLTKSEKVRLLAGHVSSFPRRVGTQRGKRSWFDVERLLNDAGLRANRRSKALLFLSLAFLVLVLLAMVLLALYLYNPKTFSGALPSSQDPPMAESPVQVLMKQELHQ